MISIDTNLLLYAVNTASPDHVLAREFVSGLASREDVALSEFVLAEFYLLLRNPAVLERPLDPGEAAAVVSTYRTHPHWSLLGFPPDSQALHDSLWKQVAAPGFARRRLFDLRTALSLQAFGVTEFATANTKDFRDLGFRRVWNPLDPSDAV